MFIAHLPAGYLLTRWLQKKYKTTKYLWVGLVASVFPDIDMFYFYLVDDRQTLHHHYWTHLPLVWVCLWMIVAATAVVLKRRPILILSTFIFANILLHFVLDTPVGGINWLYPLIDKDVFFFVVPATQSFWIWSFVFHWTFLAEIVIMIGAMVVFCRIDKNRKTYD